MVVPSVQGGLWARNRSLNQTGMLRQGYLSDLGPGTTATPWIRTIICHLMDDGSILMPVRQQWGVDAVANEQRVAQSHLQAGEQIVFIQRGGVMTGMRDPATGQPFPLDQFGTSKGWLAVTSNERVIYGYFASLGGAKFESSFSFSDWDDDPRGVAFVSTGIGPIGFCVFLPKTIAPAVLHAIMSKAFGGSDGEIRQLQELYANRVSFGAQLPTEYDEIDRVYGLLRDLEADADRDLVESEKAANAAWMRGKPWLTYYEPHLNRLEFDKRRLERDN